MMRGTVIGASELAALVGMSPYGNFESIARKKRSKNNSSYSNSACWWGTVFEDVAVKYAEFELKTNIYGTNICVRPLEGTPLHEKYVVSPDGYGVVEFVEQDTGWFIVRESNNAKRYGRRAPMTALFEFKCPHRRHPKGFVPRHYLPQVWAGLDISPFTNIGLFCEMVYWKIFRYDEHIVKKNPGFMEKCTPLIKECLSRACTQPLHV